MSLRIYETDKAEKVKIRVSEIEALQLKCHPNLLALPQLTRY